MHFHNHRVFIQHTHTHTKKNIRLKKKKNIRLKKKKRKWEHHCEIECGTILSWLSYFIITEINFFKYPQPYIIKLVKSPKPENQETQPCMHTLAVESPLARTFCSLITRLIHCYTYTDTYNFWNIWMQTPNISQLSIIKWY